MPTFNSATYAAQISGNAKDRVSAAVLCGELRYADVVYTMAGNEAAGDLIKLLELPVGAMILADLCKVVTAGIGGTLATLAKLGDLVDDDRYTATAVALTAAGIVEITAIPAQRAAPWKITPETRVITAILGGTPPVVGGATFRVQLAYLLP